MRICSLVLLVLFFIHYIRYLFRWKSWFAHVHALFLCLLTTTVALGLYHNFFKLGHIYIAFILIVVWAGDEFEEYGIHGIICVMWDVCYVIIFAVVLNVLVDFNNDVRLLLPAFTDWDMWKGVIDDLCQSKDDITKLLQLLESHL